MLLVNAVLMVLDFILSIVILVAGKSSPQNGPLFDLLSAGITSKVLVIGFLIPTVIQNNKIHASQRRVAPSLPSLRPSPASTPVALKKNYQAIAIDDANDDL